MQTKSTSNVKGIDVSHHNGNIDWQKVKADGVQFVYIKASEGSTYKDPTYGGNLKGAQAVGIKAGAYHFARPFEANAVGEAKNFVAQLQACPFDLMPCLDLESPNDKSKISVDALIKWVAAFVDYVQKATGRKVLMYTGNWFIDNFDQLWQAFKDMPLWIANYGNISAPPDGGGWTAWTIWQYSEKGSVSGIIGDVDMNVAVSLDALLCDVKPQYSVYQFDVKLGDFRSQGEATAESQKWDHSYVLNLADSTIPFSNFESEDQLNKFLTVPDYAKPAMKKLLVLGVLQDPSGDASFYRMITILDRLGLLNKQ